MTESAFIHKNKPDWENLEQFNNRLAHGGVKRLTAGEVRVFAGLFRLAGYHLAYAKTHFPGSASVVYLNRVVGVAHNHFYIRETSGIAGIKRYFLYTFPNAVREYRYYIAMAAFLFFAGAFFAAGYVAPDTSRIYHIMPQGVGGGEGDGMADVDHALLSAVIMTNNISVAVTAVGFGLTGGVGTVYVLAYNGVILGGLYAFLAGTGQDMAEFFSLILPHGVLELTAIFLCGACGLMLGKGLLIPGAYTRRYALVYQAKRAITLIPGIVVMLVVAGLIEGFFTPLALAPVVKLIFAGVTAVGFGAYVIKF